MKGDKLQEAMSADEKQELYDAIGYQEAGETEFPKEVTQRSCNIFGVEFL